MTKRRLAPWLLAAALLWSPPAGALATSEGHASPPPREITGRECDPPEPREPFAKSTVVASCTLFRTIEIPPGVAEMELDLDFTPTEAEPAVPSSGTDAD